MFKYIFITSAAFRFNYLRLILVRYIFIQRHCLHKYEASSHQGGFHLQNKTNDDVRLFQIKSQPFHYFPTGLKTVFSNLNLLRIVRCGLKKITKAGLKAFANYISLQSNKIEHFGHNLLEEPLKNIKYLHFSDSQCINENLSSDFKHILRQNCPPRPQALLLYT